MARKNVGEECRCEVNIRFLLLNFIYVYRKKGVDNYPLLFLFIARF